ncbi:MAG: AarF/ABC1/UbiB kinase family protein [Candidatus Omnitrophica bacterium]|nr:AarF/ABC1/UbiB kinase family protein [Candidatus Omnitrophota bacterium]
MLRKLKTVAADINRLRIIVLVFFEEGFGFIVEQVRLTYLLPFRQRSCAFLQRYCPVSFSDRRQSLSLPECLRRAFERLGPTFIKLGQLLSLRSDILPLEYTQALRRLQSHAAFFSLEQVKKIVREELGKEVTEIFSEFSEEPFAAASLSQVHRARLPDGTAVAVKIQRPEIRRVIEKDIHILFFLASLAERHVRDIAPLQPVKIVKQFSEWTMRELDFTVEASNAERFHENFLHDTRFQIPAIYWPYTSRRVLTMEFIEGVRLDDRQGIEALGADVRLLARNGLEIGLTQLFAHGFFQADPHPGNFFVLPGNVLCLHDFGMVGFLDRHFRDKLVQVFMSFAGREVDVTVDKVLDMAGEHTPQPRESFRRRAAPLINFWFYAKTPEKSLAKIFYDLVIEGFRCGLVFPENMVLCAKALVTAEATVQTLDPQVNVLDLSAALVDQVIRERLNPQRIVKELELNVVEYVSVLQQLPENTLKLIEKIESGQIDVRIDKSEFMALKAEMERVNSIRLVSILIVALLVSAGIILRMEEQTLLFGLSVAKIEVILAAVCIVWLVVLVRGRPLP